MGNKTKALVALSPIILMLGAYLVGALLAGDFYRIPIAVAFVLAAVYSMFLLKGRSVKDRVSVFSQGASNPDVMYMVWIFCLAGIFASSAKAMGAVDATVAMMLRVVPGQFLPVGIFVASCFISMAIGTSVGTIVALAPVVTGLAGELGCGTAWMVAIVVSGAFFGDNLSFISDTTIAATQSQGCSMKDKFKTNISLVLPAAVIVMLVYFFWNQVGELSISHEKIEWYKSLPYLLVIVLALCGMNVLAVLLCGTAMTALLTLLNGSFSLVGFFESAGQGIGSMSELIIVTLLAGGLMGVVKCLGGFDYLIRALTARISSRRGAEAAIAALAGLTNLFTANNTIAILTVGPIARDISQRYGVDPRKSASLMDTTSCFVQGFIPYGAQLLMAAGLASVSPMQIVMHLYYPFLIGVMVLLSILFGFPRKRQ